MEPEVRPKFRLRDFPLARVLAIRDFRVLWLGALMSFLGGQVQMVAQGWWIYEQTGSRQSLAMVALAFTLPIMFLAPVAGVVTDLFDRKRLLIACQSTLCLTTATVAGLYLFGRLEFIHVLIASLIGGIVQTVEAPTRQSIVRYLVGEENLAAAIPAQAMTFNLARAAGPAIGGVVLAVFGVFWCFAINSVSFFGLVISALLIRTNLTITRNETGTWRQLITEGIGYAFRTPSLRTLLLMESATAAFATFYASLMPAIAKDRLGLDEKGLGLAQACIGVGALIAILFLSAVSFRPIKGMMTRVSMLVTGLAIFGLSQATSPVVAFPLLMIIGGSVIIQFNSTNTLFQLLSPPGMQGRLIAMHLWALAGSTPLGLWIFGSLAQNWSLSGSLALAGGILTAAAIVAWFFGAAIPEPTAKTEPQK